MEGLKVEVETYEESPRPPRKYSDSDDPYAIIPQEEQKAPKKYISRRDSDGEEVKIAVSDPIIKEETLTKHVVYNIRVRYT